MSEKITNPLTNEIHVSIGSYFAHVFYLLDFDTDNVVSFNIKYFFVNIMRLKVVNKINYFIIFPIKYL